MDSTKTGKASEADVRDIVSKLKAQGQKRKSGNAAQDDFVLKKAKKSKKEKS
jgi:hypothetical protein